MLTRQDAISACLAFPASYEDYPFGEEWTVMRHTGNKKMFAAIFERQGRVWINVKAEPMWADVWKQGFSAVVPGFHMNKQHWISIILDGTMDDADIIHLIGDSYDLTKGKQKNKEETE